MSDSTKPHKECIPPHTGECPTEMPYTPGMLFNGGHKWEAMPPDPFGPVYVVGVVDMRMLALAACVGYLIGAIINGWGHGR